MFRQHVIILIIQSLAEPILIQRWIVVVVVERYFITQTAQLVIRYVMPLIQKRVRHIHMFAEKRKVAVILRLQLSVLPMIVPIDVILTTAILTTAIVKPEIRYVPELRSVYRAIMVFAPAGSSVDVLLRIVTVVHVLLVKEIISVIRVHHLVPVKRNMCAELKNIIAKHVITHVIDHVLRHVIDVNIQMLIFKEPLTPVAKT